VPGLLDFANLSAGFLQNPSMRTRRPAAEDRPVEDLFRSRLENQIDLRHPLARLVGKMPWMELEAALRPTLPADPVRGGRPALPIRLMAGLLCLKHAYDLSDEAACELWLENLYWQLFTGEVFFQTGLPCDSRSRAVASGWLRQG
jgi:IS5 family transposase